MYQFIRTPAQNDQQDVYSVQINVAPNTTLAELMEYFEKFVRASGFKFEGRIDITDVEEES